MRTSLNSWRLLWLILSLLLALGVSCNRGGLKDVGHPGPGPRKYYPPEGLGLIESGGLPVNYVPYVEDIEIPDEIHEDQPFQIVMRVSADFRPAVLRGYPHWHKTGRFTEIQSQDEFQITRIPEDEEWEFSYILYVGVTLFAPPAIGTPVDRFVFDVPGLPAGRQLVWSNTTTKRELGGVGAIYGTPYGYTGGDPEFYTDVVAIEIPITVLPVEDTGAEG